MAKSFEDYDKVTGGDKVLAFVKILGMGLLGAILGSIIPVFLLCCFGLSSAAFYLLSGCGTMLAYGILVKKQERKWYDHIALILSNIIGVFIAQFIAYIIHYAPMWPEALAEKYGIFARALRAYFVDPHVDLLKSGELYTDGGTLGVYTVFIVSAIFSIAGIYLTYIFVLASDKEPAERKKKRK